mmetsp:Transcript_13652/g.18904  ORF Transcript_13652/g.18904 Transcript_13652/m.18904 type:complete len:326 (+) Transcript_13652:534-1511(+)
MFSESEVDEYLRKWRVARFPRVPKGPILETVKFQARTSTGVYHVGSIRCSLIALQDHYHSNPRMTEPKAMKKFFSKHTIQIYNRIWIVDEGMSSLLSSEDKGRVRQYLRSDAPPDVKDENAKRIEKVLMRFHFITSEKNKALRNRFFFPLAKRIFYYRVFLSRLAREVQYKDPFDLVEAALKEFIQAEIQQDAKNREMPKETSIQHMFDQALRSVLPPSVEVCSEMSHLFDSTASIDFFLNGVYGWGLELLVKGRKLNEHLTRGDTKYATPAIKQYVTIDFRCKQCRQTVKDGRRLIRVKFSSDYAGATIWNDPTPNNTRSVTFK